MMSDDTYLTRDNVTNISLLPMRCLNTTHRHKQSACDKEINTRHAFLRVLHHSNCHRRNRHPSSRSNKQALSTKCVIDLPVQRTSVNNTSRCARNSFGAMMSAWTEEDSVGRCVCRSAGANSAAAAQTCLSQ
jgi:hypothetical protein